MLNTIADNPDLDRVCIGLFDEPDSPAAIQIRSTAQKFIRRRRDWQKKSTQYATLEINSYDSKTAPVWKVKG